MIRKTTFVAALVATSSHVTKGQDIFSQFLDNPGQAGAIFDAIKDELEENGEVLTEKL